MKRIDYANLIVGTAAEYLVCADLLLSGYHAFRADQAAPYDVAVDLGGRLVRIQVKSTREPGPLPQAGQKHITGYTWTCRHGKHGSRAYSPDAFDVLALVAIDVRRIAYVAIPNVRQTMQIPMSGMRRSGGHRTFEALSFSQAIGLSEHEA